MCSLFSVHYQKFYCIPPPSLSLSLSPSQATQHEVHIQPDSVPTSNTSPLPTIPGCQATVEWNVGILRPLALQTRNPRLALVLIDAHLEIARLKHSNQPLPPNNHNFNLFKAANVPTTLTPLTHRHFRWLIVQLTLHLHITTCYFRKSANYVIV